MIVAEELSKRFGPRTAVAAVSLQVERGEVVGFLGPNGAGKTTTLRILAGVFPPTTGRAVIDGHDVTTDPLGARRRLGYAPERPALYGEMTVESLLRFTAGMRDLAGAPRRAAVELALAQAGLAHMRDRRVGALSRGYRQRVGIAIALVGDPPVLLLDEPTAGLDPAQSAETRRLIRTLGNERAVLVSSHALAELETICDRVVILFRGRVVAAESPAALARRLRPTTRVDIEAIAPAPDLAAALAGVAGVRSVDPLLATAPHARCRVEIGPERDVRPALAACVLERGWDLLALTAVECTLEEAFLTLVDREAGRTA